MGNTYFDCYMASPLIKTQANLNASCNALHIYRIQVFKHAEHFCRDQTQDFVWIW